MDDAWYERMMPVFLDEADGCLRTMDEAIEVITRDSTDANARMALARAAHTIKGNAAALGIRQMSQDAQRIEIWAMLPATSLTVGMLAGLMTACESIRVALGEIRADASLGAA